MIHPKYLQWKEGRKEEGRKEIPPYCRDLRIYQDLFKILDLFSLYCSLYQKLCPCYTQGPLERSLSVTYHCGDVDDPLHGLGFVDAAPQQALGIQAGLGIGIAEPRQESSLARHTGQFSAIRRRGPDLHHCSRGAT